MTSASQFKRAQMHLTCRFKPYREEHYELMNSTLPIGQIFLVFIELRNILCGPPRELPTDSSCCMPKRWRTIHSMDPHSSPSLKQPSVSPAARSSAVVVTRDTGGMTRQTRGASSSQDR